MQINSHFFISFRIDYCVIFSFEIMKKIIEKRPQDGQTKTQRSIRTSVLSISETFLFLTNTAQSLSKHLYAPKDVGASQTHLFVPTSELYSIHCVIHEKVLSIIKNSARDFKIYNSV